MPEYGLTRNGLNLKRLDIISDEIHKELSDGWGVNTKNNPKSYLNVLVTAFADKIAELWEVGSDVYYAMYPSSANDVSLDYAGQFGGAVREMPAKTFYPLHCTGVDGTVIDKETQVASDTNPAINFFAFDEKTIQRSDFNKVSVKVVAVQNDAEYTVSINGEIYNYTSNENATEAEILAGLAGVITASGFTKTVLDNVIVIEANNVQSSNILLLSENLTTDSVTTIINFCSEYDGDVLLPNESITKVMTAVTGFRSCTNLISRIAGRQRESDSDFRKSYIEKIFGRSLGMLESIKSAILLNVQGVNSIKVYQNDSQITDTYGRPRNSIEIVVDGGSDYAIAEQILKFKAAGIYTFGSTSIDVPGSNGDVVTVRFNRPTELYVWFKVTVTASANNELPVNYVELIKSSILSDIVDVAPGDTIITQKLIAGIYSSVPGIDYLDILAYASPNETDTPEATDYTERTVALTIRQIADCGSSRIEVVLSD